MWTRNIGICYHFIILPVYYYRATAKKEKSIHYNVKIQNNRQQEETCNNITIILMLKQSQTVMEDGVAFA